MFELLDLFMPIYMSVPAAIPLVVIAAVVPIVTAVAIVITASVVGGQVVGVKALVLWTARIVRSAEGVYP